MTEYEKEIQELRREVKLLEEKNKELEHIHQLDMAEIAYQRRQIDFLMGGEGLTMAKKEYIEREAALNVVNGWRDQLIPTYGKNDEYVKCLETVAEHLESLHAADVRPVVLCKDCKWTETDGMEDPAIYCEKWDRWEMPPDGFCWLGKKREES